MEDLIKIHDTKNRQVVSARDLHIFLENKRDFSTWIKSRIEKYGFVDGEDYLTFHKIVERANRIEYALTIDTAKEIAMVEGNKKGKIARQYFISCEKKLKDISSYQIPTSFSEALRLAANQAEQIEKQQILISEMKPKSDAAEILLMSDDMVNIGEFAKTIGTGQNKLFEELRKDKYLIPDGGKRNLPYQKYIDQGLFIVKEVVKKTEDKVKLFSQTQITPKGQVFLANKYGSQR